MEDENNIKRVTHMDEFLKEVVVEKLKYAIDFSIRGDHGSCFRAYRSLFYLIQPYKFEMKVMLQELTDLLTNHMNSLEGKPIDSKTRIDFRNKSIMFKEIIHIYMAEIPRAYVELGLWFKVVNNYNDIEKQLSEENFNSDLSTLQNKKKELLKLTSLELINVMKPTNIHDCHAKLRILNAI